MKTVSVRTINESFETKGQLRESKRVEQTPLKYYLVSFSTTKDGVTESNALYIKQEPSEWLKRFDNFRPFTVNLTDFHEVTFDEWSTNKDKQYLNELSISTRTRRVCQSTCSSQHG